MLNAPQDILTFIVSSTEDLAKQIEAMRPGQRKAFSYANLVLCDPNVLTYSFALPDTTRANIRAKLNQEAVQLWSLPLGEIIFDHQVFSAIDNAMAGIFICTTRKVLNEYFHVLDKNKIIPLKVTLHSLASLEAFLQHHQPNGQKFCTLDFSRAGKITVSVFNGAQCDFIREIAYENAGEAKNEIVQSLRSACAKSHIKQFDCVYHFGEAAGKDEILVEIEQIFQTKIEAERSIDIAGAIVKSETFFTLNLARYYSLSLKKRDQIFKIMRAMAVTGLCVWGILVMVMFVNLRTMYKLKFSFTSADYEKAQALQKQIESQ